MQKAFRLVRKVLLFFWGGPLSIKAVFDIKRVKNGFYTEKSFFSKTKDAKQTP